jgi:hypothetical protein
MGVQYDLGPRDSVQGGVDGLTRQFNNTASFDCLARLVENHHVTGFGFRPVQAKGQHKIPIRMPWYTGREVVVNAFFEFI